MMSVYPKINVLRAQAKFISNHSNISLCQSQDVVAKIFNQTSWASLKQSAGKVYNQNIYSLPVLSLSKTNYEYMDALFELHSKTLKKYYDLKRCPPNCLLDLIINKKINRIEDNQVYRIIQNFDLKEGSTDELASIINSTDNGAANILQVGRLKPLNLWLESSFFQQRLYGYFTVEKHKVFIEVSELDSLIFIGNSKTRMDSLNWFSEYILLLTKRIDEQLKYLGYEPTFLFCKINNCSLYNLKNNSNTTKEFAVLKVVNELIDKGGEVYPPLSINDNTNAGGILIKFS